MQVTVQIHVGDDPDPAERSEDIAQYLETVARQMREGYAYRAEPGRAFSVQQVEVPTPVLIQAEIWRAVEGVETTTVTVEEQVLDERARAEFDRPFAELDRSEQCFVLTLHTEWAGTAWTSQGAQTLDAGIQVLRRDGLTVTHPGDHAAHL